MLFKSLWSVLVLVTSIRATPTEDNLHALQYENEGIASLVLKRQGQSWRNDTKTSIPSTPTREPSPVVLSSSSSAEPQKPSSKSEKAPPVDGTSTRSLFPSPEGFPSPSASNGPITSKHNDVSTSLVATVGYQSTHVSSAQQQYASSTSVSFQSPPPSTSSGQATQISQSIASSAHSSTVQEQSPVSLRTLSSTPIPEVPSLTSSQIVASLASSSVVIPVFLTPTPSQEEPSMTSQAVLPSISSSAIVPQLTPSPTPPHEEPSPISQVVITISTSIVVSSQQISTTVVSSSVVLSSVVPSSVVLSSVVQQTPPSSLLSSSVFSEVSPQQLTTTIWDIPSPPVSSSSVVNPSSVLSLSSDPTPVSLSSSNTSPATPLSQTTTIGSGAVPPLGSPAASEPPLSSVTSSAILSDPPGLPLSSSVLVPSNIETTSLINATPLPSSSILVTLSQTPSEQTPQSPSATTLNAPPENSQVLSSLTSTDGPIITASSSSVAVLPLPSSLGPVISNTLESVLSSVLPTQTPSSGYISASELWTSSVSLVLPVSSLMSLLVTTDTSTIGPSATATSVTPIMSSNTNVVPASETLSSRPFASVISSALLSINGSVTDTVSPGLSATFLSQMPSEITGFVTSTPTGSQSLASITASVGVPSLNTSANTVGSATSSTSVPSAASAITSGLFTNTSAVLSVSPSASVSQLVVSTLTATNNSASASTPQASSTRTLQTFLGWNSSSMIDAGSSTNSIRGAAMSTGSVITPTATWSNASQTSPAAVLSNSTIVNSLSNASDGASVSSVTLTINSDVWTTRTVPTLFVPTGSATSTAAASSPTPPLTTPQKAGVVIAGFAGFLLALVAVVYLVRRRYNGRRSSSGSIYPKEAYLYDPRDGGNGRDNSTLMSGGLSGWPLMKDQARAPSSTPEYGHRHSTGTMTTIFSEMGNPFHELEDPFQDSHDPLMTTPTDSAAAFSAAIRGYGAGPSQINELPATQSSHDVASMPPTTRSIVRDATSDNRGSILSEIASIAYNPRVYPNPNASRYERLPPIAFQSNQSLPCVRETDYSDPNRDTSEQDLPLRVRTGASDYMTLYAPPPISDASIGATQPPRVLSKNPWAASMLEPTNPQSSSSPLRKVVEHRSLSPYVLSPNATLVESDRYTLAYNKEKFTTYIAPSQGQSPQSPPSAPMHKGWEEFKRYSVEKIEPSPAHLSPPLGYWGQPPPRQKQSLPQLRRKEVQPFSSPDASRSDDRLPLRGKVPFSHKKSSSVPTASLDQPTKLDARDQNENVVRTQRSVNSFRPFMQRKKTGDLEFSCAGV